MGTSTYSTDRSTESSAISSSSSRHEDLSKKAPTSIPSALESHLQNALDAREQRLIRRRLPEPVALPLQQQPSSSSNTSTSNSNSNEALVDFTTNDYLSLSTSPLLRARVLEKLNATQQILGSCGSRLLVNPETHERFERRLEKFFGPADADDVDVGVEEAAATATEATAPTAGEKQVALLFNSGFDANVGFFTCIPQKGDIVVLDEYIHASVHDGVRASRVHRDDTMLFEHNSLDKLRETLEAVVSPSPSPSSSTPYDSDSDSDSEVERQRNRNRASRIRSGSSSLFVAVETLYSMDGTLAPLIEINAMLNELFPAGNAYLIVDEAHATGIYGSPRRPGRGRVAEVGLDGGLGARVVGGDGCGGTSRVLARLHTFGKALAASGAVILTTPLIRDYLINYARSLIYTTSLTHANILAVECSFDLVEDGTAEKLSNHLLALSAHFASLMQRRLNEEGIPPSLVSLPEHLLPPCTPSLSTFSKINMNPLPPKESLPPTSASSASTPISSTLTSIASPHSNSPNPNPIQPLLNRSTPTPTPIIPLLTPHPRPLSAYLLARRMNARPITWPTVPKGKDRVRVCLHAGNTMGVVGGVVGGGAGGGAGAGAVAGGGEASGGGVGDVERVVEGVVEWAKGWMESEREREDGVVRCKL